MPTYQYRCRQCGHQFEARQRMSEAPLSVCPICGGEVRRVVGSVGIVFKGKGFYVTDNRPGKSNGGGRSGKTKTKEKSDSAEPKETTKKSESSSDKKSDSKKD